MMTRGAILAGAVLLLGAGWATDAHDSRRTGQSEVRGPRSTKNVVSILLAGEQSVNMPVTIAADGTVYGGTWGLVHSKGSTNRAEWDKFDGKVFAFDRRLTSRWTTRLDHTPYCYTYGSRQGPTEYCPNGGALNGYNGTVEGVIAIDASRDRLYVGRGDGKLYALDRNTGAILWRYSTFNPADPADPDGGGEVVAGPLVASNGTIYFATVGAGQYETNAIYAVSPNGNLRWRYPSASASLPNVIFSAPALSPDGSTLYFGGAWGPKAGNFDATVPGNIYAINTSSGTLKWSFSPKNEGVWWQPTIWTTNIAVGTDGTIYAAGMEFVLGGSSAVVFALRDEGTSAAYAWPRMIDIDFGRARFAQGLALREVNGQTTRVYASSGNPFNVLAQGYGSGGKLVAVDAGSGALQWTFDPGTHGGTGAMTGITVDGEGVIYTGVSGATSGGRVYAIREDGSLLWQYALGGLLEWAQPVLGPFGDLYTADTRRCTWMDFPVESGLCNGFDVNPRIYGILSDDQKRRAARH